MIYFDNSATTPVNEEVLETFTKVSKEFIGNANSLHKLGALSRKLMKTSEEQVANLLHVKKEEVIFTSGASEANNLAIMGVILKYPHRGKHIITTKLEHSSVLEVMNYLEKQGYRIDYVNILENGLVDINHLQKLLTKETILVSIHHVNSEMGFVQNVNEIGKLLQNYQTTIFHVDGTQAVGKIPVSLENIDLYSFSCHKFFGLKGIGCLIKKNHIELEPIIHGGKSETIYRSGTPPVALMASAAKALRLALINLDEKYQHVEALQKKLIDGLSTMEQVTINSNQNSIPHIINISIKNIKPETMLHALEGKEIYISTKTACAKDNDASLAVETVTRNKELSNHSLRISLSYLNTIEEVTCFLKAFKECLEALKF